MASNSGSSKSSSSVSMGNCGDCPEYALLVDLGNGGWTDPPDHPECGPCHNIKGAWEVIFCPDSCNWSIFIHNFCTWINPYGLPEWYGTDVAISVSRSGASPYSWEVVVDNFLNGVDPTNHATEIQYGLCEGHFGYYGTQEAIYQSTELSVCVPVSLLKTSDVGTICNDLMPDSILVTRVPRG